MRVLGIETSCDETAAAVVEDGRHILSNVIYSQVDTHKLYGGIVPELASREHLKKIRPIVKQALKDARLSLDDIDGIAATYGPGLVGSLLVGLTYAKAIAFATGRPLVGVDHIEGHVYSVFVEDPEVEFPALAWWSLADTRIYFGLNPRRRLVGFEIRIGWEDARRRRRRGV